jgi:hypothetical protein
VTYFIVGSYEILYEDMGSISDLSECQFPLITRRAEFHVLCAWVNEKAAKWCRIGEWKRGILGMEHTG